MDKTLMPEAAEAKVPENDSSGMVQLEDVKVEGTKQDSPNKTAKPDEADKEHTETLQSDSVPENGDTLCSVCGFSAKCPRSLKIHYARKHGNNSKHSNRAAKATDKHANISDKSPSEIEQDTDMETESAAEVKQNQASDPNEMKSTDNDADRSVKSSANKEALTEQQKMHQEEAGHTQERRVSKRTPKPKIIHSCNYCGQEFRDKSPLDVHIQRYHTKDTPYTFDADENMDTEEKTEAPANTVKTAAKRSHSRFQLKCTHCDLRVSTPALLESHARVKHLDQEWYRCKLCNFFSATHNWMEDHLSSDSHKRQEKKKKSVACSSFEAYVESINRERAKDNAIMDDISLVAGEQGEAAPTEDVQETEEAEEADALSVEEEDLEAEPPKKKKGRPKLGSTTTCGYCGLVVSNATNLSVHVRRKHSKEYGYSCTLCNYSCVTKGDMDRHCITKKHIRRAQECANKNVVSNDTSDVSPEESTTAQTPEANEASEMIDEEQVPDNATSKEQSGEEQTQSDNSQKQTKYDSVNACIYCDFVAQSIPSLHLHVRRKHTKDFAYVCLACNYYAVTSREMSRHASSDKHKQKSQKYLETLGSEEQKTLTLQMKVNPNPESNTSSLTEEAESSTSRSDEDQAAKSPKATESCAAMEAADGATDGATEGAADGATDGATEGAADGATEAAADDVARSEENEKQVENPTSSSTGEPGPTNPTSELNEVSETQSAELEPVTDQSEQQESQDEGSKKTEDQRASSDEKVGSIQSDTQMSRALPFDACIVSTKALVQQEHVLQEGLAAEGEAAVICLTGSPGPSTRQPFKSAFVKKLVRKKGKANEDGKGNSSRIRCEDCGFMADGISGLNVHISMKHPSKEKRFHCLVCGKSFYSESNLHQHLTSAAHLRNEVNSVEELPEGGASFKCVKCMDRFESEQELFVHIKEKHEELLTEVNKYVVEDTEQINREREENQGCVCKYCGKACKSSNSMAFLAHIRTHTGSKPFMCKICNFATAQLGDARNHVKRHLGMREYKCDICGWAFVMKKHLSTHLLGKHGIGQRKERKFECDLCDRTFSEKWALNNHMKLHRGDKPYKCGWPSCHYAFLNLSAMKDHYRTHIGEKSYLCDLCGFAGGTKHALTKHRRQHTDPTVLRTSASTSCTRANMRA
ncbi:uncharacterized protein V6R79_014553 [Siganus canaliculatus]